MSVRFAVPFVLVLAGAWACPLAAQELRPLAEILEGDYDGSYPFVRCASFYLANLEWAGATQLGAAAAARLDESILIMLDVGISIRAARQGVDETTSADGVIADARMIADIYLVRYRQSYATSGQAWASDSLWISDLEHCRILTESVEQLLSE